MSDSTLPTARLVDGKMQAIQLELNLWNNLEAAASPLAANMNQLWQELEAAITSLSFANAPLPQQLQLAIVPEAILRIAQIQGKRAQSLLDGWEATHECDDEPILNEDESIPLTWKTRYRSKREEGGKHQNILLGVPIEQRVFYTCVETRRKSALVGNAVQRP